VMEQIANGLYRLGEMNPWNER